MSDFWVIAIVVVVGLIVVGGVMAFFARRDRDKRRAARAAHRFDSDKLRAGYARFDNELSAQAADHLDATKRRKREAAAQRRSDELAADMDLTGLAAATGVYGSSAPDPSPSHPSSHHHSSGSGSHGYGHSGSSHDYGSSHSGGSDSGGGGDSGGGSI